MARYGKKHQREIADVMRQFRTGQYAAVWLQRGSETWGLSRVSVRSAAAHLLACPYGAV